MNIDEKSAKGVQHYFFGYAIIILCLAVGVLFYMYSDLNVFIRNSLFENTKRMEQVIERNTDAINSRK